MTIQERFYAKVDKRCEHGCWIWRGGINKNGYGGFAIKGKPRTTTHRISWSFNNGKIPKGMWVLHKCDNPSCVNPSHLFLGTPRDNTRDMIAKKRNAFGDRDGMAVLSEEDVLKIRSEYLKGKTQEEVAKDFSVSPGAVSGVLLSKTWKHLRLPAIRFSKADRAARGSKQHSAKVTENDVIEIRRMRAAGESVTALRTRFNISDSAVRLMCARKTWRHVP